MNDLELKTKNHKGSMIKIWYLTFVFFGINFGLLDKSKIEMVSTKIYYFYQTKLAKLLDGFLGKAIYITFK